MLGRGSSRTCRKKLDHNQCLPDLYRWLGVAPAMAISSPMASWKPSLAPSRYTWGNYQKYLAVLCHLWKCLVLLLVLDVTQLVVNSVQVLEIKVPALKID